VSAALVRSAPVTRARFAGVLGAGACAAFVALAASLFLGAERVDVLAVLAGGGSPVDREIFLHVRLPRVLVGMLVGGALGTSGVALQTLLRNPLAEPYLLGISGGGSLGAVLAIVLLGAGTMTLPLRIVAALAGCLLALSLVYAIATKQGALRPASLLLAGVVVNSFFLAGLVAVQFGATPHQAQTILRWMLGGLDAGGRNEVIALAVVVPLGAVALLRRAPALHALLFGEETAAHLGVDVARTRRSTFLAASLVTAASVAVAGPIGFVGLVVPHAARLFVGSDPRVLLPAAAFAGAAFLPLADAVARMALAPRELPVGVVTALVGAPAFIVLVVRRRAETEGLRV
jgi:iron complex transport system permease protein